MRADLEVPVERLRVSIDPAVFPFETTTDRKDVGRPAACAMVFHPRARSALEHGVAVRGRSAHAYASGAPGLGKLEAVLEVLRKAAADRPRPDDWVYVHDFRDEDRPRALRFPAGRAVEFAREVDDLIDVLRREIPRAFESEEHAGRHREVAQEIEARRHAHLSELQARAEQLGFALREAPFGWVTVPVVEGHPLDEEHLRRMTPEERRELEARRDQVKALGEQVLRKLRELEREGERRRGRLDRERTLWVVQRHVEDLAEKYHDRPDVQEWLSGLREDIIANGQAFRRAPEAEAEQVEILPGLTVATRSAFRRYKVNVLVDNGRTEGAPVVVEITPTFPNLIGRIERRIELGALTTDFTQIRAGALHRANGGFLVLYARDLLGQMAAYDGLKRCLRSGRIEMEDLAAHLGLATVGGDAAPPDSPWIAGWC